MNSGQSKRFAASESVRYASPCRKFQNARGESLPPGSRIDKPTMAQSKFSPPFALASCSAAPCSTRRDEGVPARSAALFIPRGCLTTRKRQLATDAKHAGHALLAITSKQYGNRETSDDRIK